MFWKDKEVEKELKYLNGELNWMRTTLLDLMAHQASLLLDLNAARAECRELKELFNGLSCRKDLDGKDSPGKENGSDKPRKGSIKQAAKSHRNQRPGGSV
jgi:hypothetical protein